MSSQRWNRIDEIFAQATSLPESERQAFVDLSCADDSDLRAEVNGLLTAHSGEGAFDRLEESIAGAVGAALPSGLDSGALVGQFRIREVLGHGGMGVVYLADRDGDGFRQVVAIKVLRAGIHSPESTRRFLAERRILARLEHPNIPRFLDGGLTTDGAPYFAMEFVEGTPLTTYCNERRLSVRRRLELFAAVCDAMQYAHSHLVVHRDLKPTNILVTPDGVVKVLDFGIAKLLDTEREGETGAGQRWMTLDYASPEQIRGGPVTTAADVFALGVVLYELLTGRRPHTGSGRHAVEREILETEPNRPSATGIGAGFPGSRFPDGCDSRELVGDLDMITLKALNKAPERRYGTAGELADDIRRHLAGLPVRARPDTFAYRARKFVSRRRRLVTVLAFAALSLLTGAVMTLVAMNRARASALQASLERDRAEQVSRFVVDLFSQADPLLTAGSEVSARQLLDSGAARLSRDLADQPERRARLLGVLAQSYDGLGRYVAALTAIAKAIALRRTESPVDTAALAALLERQARLYSVRGLADSARAPALEGLALMNARGDRDALLASDLLILGDLYHAAGVFDSSEHYLRVALRATGNANPAARGDLLDNLAAVQVHQGKFAAAESILVEALEMRRRQWPAGHPNIASALGSLSDTRFQLGKFAQARADMGAAIPMMERTLGAAHPYLAHSYHQMGAIAEALGQPDSAIAPYEASIRVRVSLFGASHPSTARARMRLGNAYRASGQASLAEDQQRRALTVLEAKLPAGNRELLFSRAEYAETLIALRRYAAAAAMLASVRAPMASLSGAEAARRLRHVDELLAEVRRRQ